MSEEITRGSRNPIKNRPEFQAQEQSKFLEMIANGWSQKKAAESTVFRDPKTWWRWLQQDPAFKAAYEEALELGIQVLEDEARRRAVEGVDEPVVSAGKIIIDKETGRPMMVRKYSDNLLSFLLRGKRPDVYGGKEGGTTVNINITGAADKLRSKFAELFGPDVEEAQLVTDGPREDEKVPALPER